MRARIVTSSLGLLALAQLALAQPGVAQTSAVTLDEAVNMALRVQPAMVQARGQVTTAAAAKRQVIGSWLPSLSASSGTSRSSTRRYDQATQREVTGSNVSYSAGISSSLTLFDGLSRFYDGRAANADALAAEASLVNQRFQTILQVKQTFFSALAAEELVRVSETRIERALEQLKVSKEMLANGTATRSDTLRSTVEVANARLQKLNAETQLATAEANLARLIGVDGTVSAIYEERLLDPVVIDTTAIHQEAYAASPSVLQADANQRAAEANYAAAFAQYLPSVSTSGSYSWSGNEFVSDWNSSWSIRLSVSYSLFNGFNREANRTRSAVSRDNARAQAAEARRQVNASLTQQLAALRSAEISLEIALGNRAASEEDLRVQQERYRVGNSTILDVLLSQVNLDQAEVDIIQARLDYLTAKAQIEALIGREL
ncbi:MAG: TolC family protein [Gemmatimonadales bacterium]